MSGKSWFDALANEQAALKTAGLWRRRRQVDSAQQPIIKSDQQWLINFSSNDYLGLASHPTLVGASQQAAEQWGVGAGASHLVCGHQTPHHDLEERLADFVGAERALLFSSGYMANLALNTALLAKGDLVLHDRLNHASLIDGARLSAAQFKRYAHSDCAHARKRIASTEFNRLMLVSDGVFSMDGDIAPLDDLAELVSQQQGVLCVDDAHGFGVLGDAGRGTLSHLGMAPTGNVLMMGTLSKAMGCFGAFVAGDSVFIEHLIQSARSYIYTTALPANVVLACSAALNLLKEQQDQLLGGLIDLIAYFKTCCHQAGVLLMPSDTPIQPVLIGDESVSVAISEGLQNHGFLVPAIRTPTVPKGQARLRVTLTAAHTKNQIDDLVLALAAVIKSNNLDSMVYRAAH